MTASNDKRDFRAELLRRFFNPKSYFYARHKARLEKLQRDGQIHESDLILIERFLQRMEDASNVASELVKLSVIGRFQAFHQELYDTIDRLETASLDMDGMKAEIDRVAAFLADTLRDVLHSDDDRPRLLDWLGVAGAVAQPSAKTSAPASDSLPAEAEAQSPEEVPFGPEVKAAAAPAHASRQSETMLAELLEETGGHEGHELELPFDLEKEPAEAEMPRQPVVSMASESDSSPSAEEAPETETGERVELEISDEEFEDWLDSLRAKEQSVHEEVEESPAAPKGEDDPSYTAGTFDEEGFMVSDLMEASEPEGAGGQSGQSSSVAFEEATEPQESFLSLAEDTLDSMQAPAAPSSVAVEPEMDLDYLEDIAVPEGLTHAVRSEMAGLVRRLQRVLKASAGKKKSVDLAALESTFEQMRDVAMIHGSEEIEEVATKAWRACMSLRALAESLPASVVPLFSEVEAVLSALVNRTEEVKGSRVGALIHELSRLERSPQTFLLGRKDQAPESPPESRKEAQPSLPSLPVAPAETERKDTAAKEEDTFHLPGEDDAELMQLIKEVRRESGVDQAAAPRRQAQPSITDESPALQTRQRKTAPRKAAARGTVEKSGGGMFERFVAEAELYFGVFEEALARLKQQPHDPFALEDVELAAYSLKGLCRKLGLDRLALLPEAMEKYAAGLISREQPIDRAGWLAIFRAVHTLRSVAQDPDDRQKSVWSLVRTIKHLTKPPMLRVVTKVEVAKNSRSSMEAVEEEERERRFRLRGRRSRVGAFGF